VTLETVSFLGVFAVLVFAVAYSFFCLFLDPPSPPFCGLCGARREVLTFTNGYNTHTGAPRTKRRLVCPRCDVGGEP
jgi:hypothetical protein